MLAEVDPTWALRVLAIAIGPALGVAAIVALGYVLSFLISGLEFVVRRFRGL